MGKGTDEGFDVWLRTHFDGDALKAAQQAFNKTKQGAKETDSTLKDMGYTAENLKSQLTGLLAAGAVWQQFKEGFEQVAALEQTMNQLERAAKRNGDNFDVVRGKIVGMAEALKKAAGVDDDAAIKKMSELYNATGDVANAMDLVALATDVAVGAGLDFERANDLVTRAAMGQTRGLKELNIALEEGEDKTENANKALAAIRKNFGGAANDAKGLKVEINRLSEAYEDFRNNAIESTTPILTAWLKFAKTWVAVVAGAGDMIGEVIYRVGVGIMKVGDAVGFLMSGNVAQAKAALKDAGKEMDGMFDQLVESARVTAAKIEDVWSGTQRDGGIAAGKPTAIVTGGGGETAEQKAAREKAAKEAEALAKRVFDFEQGLIKERAAAWAKYQANKLALAKGSAKEMERIEKELDRERERMMDAQTQRIVDQVRLQKKAQEAELEGAVASANAAIDLAGAVFGESKGIAIAQAIINTYEGASKALAQGGVFGTVLAAIVIAAGLAQVAKISSTEPSGGGDSTRGRGFDVASYDAAAVAGGRRWAMDMIGKWGSGASAGWADGMARGGSVTNNNQSTVNLHMSGVSFLDPSDQHHMASFARKLAVVNKTVEGQRRTARTSR